MGHWFVDTAGIGSIIVVVAGGGVLMAYVRLLRWIQSAPPEPALPAAEPGGPAHAGVEGKAA